MANCRYLETLLVSFVVLVNNVLQAGATNFAQCNKIYEPLLRNGTIYRNISSDLVYNGPIHNFDYGSGIERPLTLTLKGSLACLPLISHPSNPLMHFYLGCQTLCGSPPQLNDAPRAFQILTTWVLPFLALIASLPFQSGNYYATLSALCNWIGSPQTAFTSNLFDLYQLRRCCKCIASRTGDDKQGRYTNALYVLSCINQYEYPRYRNHIERWGYDSKEAAEQSELERNTALLFGLFRPLRDTDGNHSYPWDVTATKLLLDDLVHQLRLQRRRGEWPIVINTTWFAMSFVVSLVLAFADLGDNTTAHSLALGLLLSWLPALVIVTAINRCPVASTRCKVMI